MKLNKGLWGAAAVTLVLGGCASQPDELPTSYVSPLKYKDHDCDQIVMEMDQVSQRTNELYSRLTKKADHDAAQMGIGLLLFWPALLFLEGGDGPEAAEYSTLKGEYSALHSVAVQNKCEIPAQIKSPSQIIEEHAEKERKAREQES